MKKKYQILTKTNVIVFAITFVLSTLVFLLLVFLKSNKLYDCLNYSFVIGIVLFLLSLFIIIVNFGMFDLIAVGFANLFSVIKKGGTKKYDGLYGYQEAKSDARKGNRFLFLPVLLTGSAFIILSIIMRIIWQNTL